MKKFILFMIVLLIISSIAGIFIGKKRVIKNGVLSIGTKLWQDAPKGVDVKKVTNTINMALIAVERDNFSFDKVKKIDSLLLVIEKSKSTLDSTKFLFYLSQINSLIDTVEHK